MYKAKNGKKGKNGSENNRKRKKGAPKMAQNRKKKARKRPKTAKREERKGRENCENATRTVQLEWENPNEQESRLTPGYGRVPSISPWEGHRRMNSKKAKRANSKKTQYTIPQ